MMGNHLGLTTIQIKYLIQLGIMWLPKLPNVIGAWGIRSIHTEKKTQIFKLKPTNLKQNLYNTFNLIKLILKYFHNRQVVPWAL